MNLSKTIIIISGPTAVGKTSFAIQLAKKLNTEIISADSRQCYQELDIAVAKPSKNELSQIKHHFINSHSIHSDVNAVVFEQYALQAANTIFQKHSTAVMVGGTGLYIKAFCEGLDNIPEVSKEVHDYFVEAYNLNGIEWLQQQLQQNDPDFWEVAEQQNPHRLMRALEVFKATGKSISQFRKKEKAQRDFNIVKIGLELPKEQLHKNIHTRIDKMVQNGLLQEAENLLQFRHLNALQTVGYREFFDYFDKKCTLDEAVEQLKINTRRYAKRQITWFKKDTEIQWLSPLQAQNYHS